MKTEGKLPRGNWAIILPLAAGVGLYLWLFFLPGMRATAEIREELRNKQEEVLGQDELRKSEQDIQQELTATQAFNKAWDAHAPSDPEVAALFGKITEQANLAGVTTTRFEPQAGVDYELFRQVPLQMSVKGTYAEIYALLAGLEQLGQTIWIDNVALDATQTESTTLGCDLQLVVFADSTKNSDGANPAALPILEEPAQKPDKL